MGEIVALHFSLPRSGAAQICDQLEFSMTNFPAVHNTHPKVFVLLGVQMKILLSSSDTGDQFSLVEGIMPPGGDGGLHIHLREDESMHLLEGQLKVTIGEKVFDLKPGESYFAPRGIPQRLRNRGSVPARSLMIMSPSTFDKFIACAGVPVADGEAPPAAETPTPEQIQRLLAVAQRFGIKILEAPKVPLAAWTAARRSPGPLRPGPLMPDQGGSRL
jgi:mannose-6-phosphate isomerase-like protein (cupin superfamily)